MDRQKTQARAAGKFKMDRALEYTGEGNTFTGYEKLEAPAKVVALYFEGAAVQQLTAGQGGVVVLDSTPFYSESGGQVGDQGAIVGNGSDFEVGDTQKIKSDVFGHHGTLTSGALKVGDACDGARQHRDAHRHPAQPQRDAPDAQGAARSAGQPCAAKGQPGGRREDAL
jgi:alanyl-tRNA synthetase